MNTLIGSKERLDLNDLQRGICETDIIGAVCRDWSDGSHIQKHILFNRQKFVSNNLKKVIDLINYAEKNGVISFQDFCSFLKKEDLNNLEQQFCDMEINFPTLSSIYFKRLIKKNEAPYLGEILSQLSESVASGATPLEELLELLSEYKHSDIEEPVQVMTLEELTLQPKVEWLIEGVIPSNALACIFGPPGSGKSFLALDMALRVAHGGHWRDCETRQGHSLYIAGEGCSGLSDRVNSWLIYHDSKTDNYTKRFSAIAKPVNVTGDFCDLIKAVKNQKNTPDLIIIDTLARCFGPNDENSTSDMQKFILALDSIRLELQCTVLVIHHSSKAEKVALRGNSALEGCLDTVIKVEALEKYDGKAQRIVAQVVKQKDAEGFQKYYYELEPFEDSAVMRELSGSVITGEKRGTEAGLLQALKDMIHSEDQWISATQWRKAYPKMGPDFGNAVKRLVELEHVLYKSSGATDLYRLPNETL